MAATTIVFNTAVATAASISNATDVAGNISITPNGSAGIAATITFGYAYADTSGVGSGTSSCQVIITPTNQIAASDMNKIYVSSTTTGTFVLSIMVRCIASVHTYNYHIIETQSGNGTGSGLYPGFTYGGSPAYNSATASQGTDVAGRINFDNFSTAGSVTCQFGYAYVTAPIVVLTAYHSNTALNWNFIWVSSTTNDFTINYNAGAIVGSNIFSYHCIETQA